MNRHFHNQNVACKNARTIDDLKNRNGLHRQINSFLGADCVCQIGRLGPQGESGRKDERGKCPDPPARGFARDLRRIPLNSSHPSLALLLCSSLRSSGVILLDHWFQRICSHHDPVCLQDFHPLEPASRTPLIWNHSPPPQLEEFSNSRHSLGFSPARHSSETFNR